MNNHILNHLIKNHGVKNDAHLARIFESTSSKISNMRKERVAFGPTYILRTHDLFGMEIRDIKALIAQTDEVKNVDD